MTLSTQSDILTCACGTGRLYDDCCGPHIRGEKPPATAEALMRSRYTAYARHHVDYIVATHDPKGVADVDREATEQWARDATWQGLRVLSTERGQSDDADGIVEFVAHYEQDGEVLEHHERSRFRKIDGAWFYVDGDMVKAKPVVRDQPKVGRNEPCPCGSGRKFKKCCGAA